MARVFVSHAHEDGELAATVREWLVADGHDVFLDVDRHDGIPAGGRWKEHLYEKVRWASALVCLVTDAFNASQWCFAEVFAAKVVGCPVLPLATRPELVNPLLGDDQHVMVCGSSEGEGRERLLAYLREADLPGGAGWPEGRSPFPGLRPFEPDMHAAFFGRAAETETVVRLLRASAEQGERQVLAVTGPSGCGKSSLVRAGVHPAMAREPGWAVLPPVSPGKRPVAGLARAFAEVMVADEAWAASRLRRRIAAEGLLDVVEDFLTARRPAAHRLLLVVDQFEEVLTRAEGAGRRELAQALTPAVAAGVLSVVVTMRSEFLDPAGAEFPDLTFRSFPLRPLDPAILSTVVEAPMKLAGLQITPDLVSRMVADTGGGDGLPLLAYTLEQLAMGLPRGAAVTAYAYDGLPLTTLTPNER